MSEELGYRIFDTSMGWIGVLVSEKGLVASTLPLHTAEEAFAALGPDTRHAVADGAKLADVAGRLRAYLEGERVDFPDDLDLTGGTPFQRRVWEATRCIPHGETRTYRDIARQVGAARAARAVGQALGANPLPIVIPCHRVIARGGGLGGFGGGVEMKRRLLEMEGGIGGATAAEAGTRSSRR